MLVVHLLHQFNPKNRSNFFLLHPFVHFSDPFQILVAIQRIDRRVCVTSPWNATHTKPSHTLAGWGLLSPAYSSYSVCHKELFFSHWTSEGGYFVRCHKYTLAAFIYKKKVLFVPFVYTSILTTPTRAREKEKIFVFIFRYVENKPSSTHSLTYKHTHSQTISATSLQQTNNNNTERKLLLNTTQPCSIYLFTISHYKRKRFEV